MRTSTHWGSQMGAPKASAHFRKQTFWEKSLPAVPTPTLPAQECVSRAPRVRGGGALPRAPARVGAKLRRSGPRPPACGSASRRPARTSHGSLRGVLSLGVKPNTFPHLRDAGPGGGADPPTATPRRAGHCLSAVPPSPTRGPGRGDAAPAPLYLRPSGCTAPAAG